GASVPVAVRAITALAKQTGQNTARVIAWNTLGAAVGALGTGLIVLPTVGFEGAIRFAAGLCFLAATVVLWRVARRPGIRALALLAIAVVLWVPAKEAEPLLRASSMRGARPDGLLLYSAVGRASSVVALARHRGVLLRTNGLPEARVSYAGSLSKVSPAAWMAALPSLARPSARRAMVIGLGAGNTLAGFLPWVERIDVAEIEPEVVNANRILAPYRDFDPLADERVNVKLTDARAALLRSESPYDIIVSQPSHPWTRGSSHLFTREFAALAKSRLAPDGIFAQWIGAGFVDEQHLKIMLTTLLAEFERVRVENPGAGFLLLMASDEPMDATVALPGALARYPGVLTPIGIRQLDDVRVVTLMNASDARRFSQGSEISTDDSNPFLTFTPARQESSELLLGSGLKQLRVGEYAMRSLNDAIAPEARLRAARLLLERGYGVRAKRLLNESSEIERSVLELVSAQRVRAWRRFDRVLERLASTQHPDFAFLQAG
ncbi:MAG: fused MFS/spermidine synthase, partial [Myxococcota bacterium]